MAEAEGGVQSVRSKVKEQIASPKGSFPLLEKGGVKKHGDIFTGGYLFNMGQSNLKGQHA